MKTNIIGWYGQNNCGDEAFKDAFKILLPEDELIFSLEPVEADRYILGGGDVIKRLYLDKLSNKKFCIVGAGLGYESEVELLLDRRQDIKWSLFRSGKDTSLVKDRGLPAAYIPDLVFALPQPLYVKRERPGKKQAVVVLNDAVNPTYGSREKLAEFAYAEYLKWEIADALSYLTEWYDFTFVPFSDYVYNTDTKIHQEVMQRMDRRGGSNIIKTTQTPTNTLELIAQADLVITMKFHGIIFSVIANTPFVNIGLSRKTHLFCEEEGLADLSMKPFSFTKDSFLEHVINAEKVLKTSRLTRIQESNRALLINRFDVFARDYL